MGKLTAAERHHLPKGDFAGPHESYPVNDPSHARNALARVSQHGSPALKAAVRAKVHAKYPGIEQAHHPHGNETAHKSHDHKHAFRHE